MRLWSANQGSWRKLSESWHARVMRTGLIDHLLGSYIDLFKLDLEGFKRIETELLGEPLTPEKTGTNQTFKHKRKQCPSCAKIKYHCWLFDLPWVKVCPAHRERLLDRCQKCGQAWPTASNVGMRSCEVCGIQQNIDELISQGAMASLPNQPALERLLALFQQDVTILQPLRNESPYVAPRYETIAQNNLLPWVLPNFDSYSSDFNVFSIKRHEFFIREYELQQGDSPCPDARHRPRLGIINRARRIVFRQVQRSLHLGAKHTLGQCDKHSLLGHYECCYCETWRQLSNGFKSEMRDGLDAILLEYSPPFTRRVTISDPGLISTLYDPKRDHYYTLNYRAQVLVYSIEVWQAIQRMIHQINFYLQGGNEMARSIDNHPGDIKLYLSHQLQHFCYFYFVKKDDGVTLRIPKDYVTSSSDQQQDVSDIFKELD